jgi:ATP-dependent exoDNAse (exonuclease V) alpha subunit
MAIYHCSIKIISRSKGKSAVAAAAYRSGETLTNEYDGITHDYTRKRGIVHTEILLPDHAPCEYERRAVLWNAVEKIEKAKNSQLAREIELALPAELTQEQNISLIRDYVKQHFVSAGMCADICVHDKNDGNPHAHVMLTMRPILENGIWGDKQKKEYILDRRGDKIYDPKKKQYKCKSVPTTDWNEQTKAEKWRAAWAQSVNAVLERQNIAERVDHRSYERQGVEQIPTIHLGVSATQMERKGIETDRGNINREIVHHNNLLFAILAKLKELKARLKDALSRPAPDSLQGILQGILERGEQPNPYSQIRNMKMVSEALMFLQENDINTLPGLRTKFNQIRNEFDRIRYSRGSLAEYDAQSAKVVVAQRVKQTVEIAASEYARRVNPQQRKMPQRDRER